MRVLLDTNILIHREASVVSREDIGVLFNWLDRLHYEKCVHPVSLQEIKQHRDERVRRTFEAKLTSYRVLQHPAPMREEIRALSAEVDQTTNDLNDSRILNELLAERVDFLITEDRGIAKKAERLGIAEKVFSITEFLEKVTAENPELIDYKVLAVRKVPFGLLDVSDPFFDSFRLEYPGFDKWFGRKSDESAYVCFKDDRLVAFLYLKQEDEREPYPDIVPGFLPKRRLKIGTMKVELNGQKLGERFLKIAFDNALKMRADEIYVTLYRGSPERERLVRLLEDFGFTYHGKKHNPNGEEEVYVRDMTPRYDARDPRLTFPYVSRSARAFLVPIYPKYHTDLLPDSILQTESPEDFVENEPYRNAIRKVYISRSLFRDLESGDVMIFYRTGGYHRSVVTTLGIIERIHTNFRDEDDFVRRCRKRSVFTDHDLRKQWRCQSPAPPFIVDFLYAYSFPRRPNMAALIKHGVIRNVWSAPRGFERITDAQFATILRLAEADPRVIVD